MPHSASRKLKAIELVIGAKALRAADLALLGVDRPTPTDDELAQGIDDLFTYVLTVGATATVCNAERTDRATLKTLYDKLESEGAPYWVQGRYVPAASLADDYTLSYLLKAMKRNEITIVTVNQILGYFDGLTKRLLFPDEKGHLITKNAKKEGR